MLRVSQKLVNKYYLKYLEILMIIEVIDLNESIEDCYHNPIDN